jgi:myosin heavy subunit
MFRGCKSEDMPPHIYSLAQSAYHGMLASRRDHSIVLQGRSGSGKTTNFKHILHYLVLAAGAVNKVHIFALLHSRCSLCFIFLK